MTQKERMRLHFVLGVAFTLAGCTFLLLRCGISTASFIGCLVIGLLCGMTAHNADTSIH